MAIHRGLAASGRSRSSRNSFSFLTVDLNLGELRRFMQQTIASFSSDADLATSADAQFAVLCAHFTEDEDQGFEACHEELDNCVVILSSFLAGASEQQDRQRQPIPSAIILEAHSLIGCIHESLHHHKLAVLSYLKALWIASATADGLPSELLAVTMHRLGRAYSSTGAYAEAHSLLQKAVTEYAQAGVHRNHAVVVDARELLSWVNKKRADVVQQQKQQEQQQRKQSKRWSSYALCSLSLIQEEEPTERRMSM